MRAGGVGRTAGSGGLPCWGPSFASRGLDVRDFENERFVAGRRERGPAARSREKLTHWR